MSQRLWSKDFIFVTIVNLFMYLILYMLIVTITQFTNVPCFRKYWRISSWCIYHWHASWKIRRWKNHRSSAT